jgi:hypothetical protein
MNRATYMECIKFQKKILKVDINQDLDDIIEMHDSYMDRVIQLTLLDGKSKDLVRFITDVADICQEFRKLIVHYLLNGGDEFSDSDEEQNKPERRRLRSIKEIEEDFNGMGLLIFGSSSFNQNFNEFSEKLEKLK